jgi:hypothetical protein
MGSNKLIELCVTINCLSSILLLISVVVDELYPNTATQVYVKSFRLPVLATVGYFIGNTAIFLDFHNRNTSNLKNNDSIHNNNSKQIDEKTVKHFKGKRSSSRKRSNSKKKN